MWSPKGGSVLALALSDVDATNQSYYGEQKLYYLAADGKKDCAVELPKSGPIHDVQWSPRGDYFVVVAGFMPAKAILFSHTCVPKFDLGKCILEGSGRWAFTSADQETSIQPSAHSSTKTNPAGSGPYSLVRWNPFGRYFVLAGFGNLPGDLAFYEVAQKSGNCKRIGATR